MATIYFIGVDVGTASVRAGLFDYNGKLVRCSTSSIQIWNPAPNHYEQSSDDIWSSCCQVVKDISKDVEVDCIKGIGFDATCSLVVLGRDDLPVSASTTGCNKQNVIMWMDHRANEETAVINATKHSSLRFVGGNVSIEMQLPKLLWLKKNCLESWQNARLFFDLPDFLTWRATGSQSRSQCSLVCKWNYDVDPSSVHGWPHDLFRQIGLEEFLTAKQDTIGKHVMIPGNAQGGGLTEKAAQEMGLRAGTSVGVSLIDAYAGTLGLLACRVHPQFPVDERLAVICGTSACHMLSTNEPIFVDGVWGPYSGVLLPNRWVLEGGQSAVGKLLDHIIESHPSYNGLKKRVLDLKSIPDELIAILNRMAEKDQLASVSLLSRQIHVYPDFHGNRSPLSDPLLKGMICGLTLDASEENLALLYLATVQSLCYGTRHIIETLRKRGAKVSCMLLCGGLAYSRLFVTTLADTCCMPVILPHEKESVLLGSAMLGACASQCFASLQATMDAMGGLGCSIPAHDLDREFHQRKYSVFLKMLEHQKEYDRLMRLD